MRLNTISGASLRGSFPAPKGDKAPPDLKPKKDMAGHVPTSDPVKLVLPVPPSVNNLYATGSDGKRHKTRTARSYANRVKRELTWQFHQKFEGQIGVRIRVYRKRRVGDIDNFKKALYDSLKGKCWNDDKQIVYEESFRDDDPKNPRVEVEIWEIQP